MTGKDIEKVLEKMELPFHYHHFSTEDVVDPPFLIWIIPGTDNFFADGIVYRKIDEVNIELYTDEKNLELEEKLENILEQYGIAWQKTASEWLESEKMWETLYEMEV